MLGYEVDSREGRERAAALIRPLIMHCGRHGDTRKKAQDEYGQRWQTEILITGPNGKQGTLKAGWIRDQTGTRLLTAWVEPHVEEK